MGIGREELRNYFKAGELPTEKHFRELINSMLHMEDEGFSKSRLNGLEITSALGEPGLVTFYRKEDPETALWRLQQSDLGSLLSLAPVAADKGTEAQQPQPALLNLRNNGRVGVGTITPAHALDVNGVIGSTARTGTYFTPDPEKPPLPNGEWQVLATGLTGCVGFEVMASAAGAPNEGRYAVMHAIALNAYNPRLAAFGGWFRKLGAYIDRSFNRKKRIQTQNAWCGQRCDRLELAWRPAQEKGKSVKVSHGSNGSNGNDVVEPYELVIRSRCDYGPGGELQVRVTQLWPVAEPDDDLPRAAAVQQTDKRTTPQRKVQQRKAERRA